MTCDSAGTGHSCFNFKNKTLIVAPGNCRATYIVREYQAARFNTRPNCLNSARYGQSSTEFMAWMGTGFVSLSKSTHNSHLTLVNCGKYKYTNAWLGRNMLDQFVMGRAKHPLTEQHLLTQTPVSFTFYFNLQQRCFHDCKYVSPPSPFAFLCPCGESVKANKCIMIVDIMSDNRGTVLVLRMALSFHLTQCLKSLQSNTLRC